MKEFYTTGEVAKICNIAPKTVVNYCEAGKLKNEQSPVTGYRRIPRDELLRFMEQYKIHISKLNQVELKKILIVEDDKRIAELITQALAPFSEQVEVSAVYDGYNALVEIGMIRPDLVILDILLPRIYGFVVCKKLKENPATSSIKICAISVRSDKDTEQRILENGADVFLKKPFEIKQLIDAIETLLKVTFTK